MIESAVRTVNARIKESGGAPLPPATPEEIATLEESFARAFRLPLPEALAEVLSVSNGLRHSRLVVWPTKAYGPFDLGLVDLNQDHEERALIYFARLDDLFYVYDNVAGRFASVDDHGESFDYFRDCEEMLGVLMLRVLASRDC